MDVGIFSFSQD